MTKKTTFSTNFQWQIIESLLNVKRKPKWDLRNIWEAICYVTRTGCQWRLLPLSYPPWQTVYWYFRRWTMDGTIEIAHQEIRKSVRKGQGNRSNPNFEKSGNPNLRPVLLNDLQLGYNMSKKLSLTVGLGYSFFNRLDLRVIIYDSATNITRSTFDNVGKGSRTGLDFNVGYPITPGWNFSLNGNIAYFIIKGQVGGDFINNTWFTYFFAPSTSYRFKNDWAVNANLTVNSRNPVSLQGTSNSMVSSSFSVNKTLNKFSFSAFVNNPFSKCRRNYVTTAGDNFAETSNSLDYFRSIGISINYRFGKLQGEISKSKRKIINDDVSKKE